MSKLCRVALQVPRLRQSQRQADKREAEESQFPQTESQSQHEPVPKHGKGKGRGNLNIFIDLNADVIQLIYIDTVWFNICLFSGKRSSTDMQPSVKLARLEDIVGSEKGQYGDSV